MRKYTMLPFSSKLGLSIDLWSEVAVLIMARQEITKMLLVIKVSCAIEYGFRCHYVDNEWKQNTHKTQKNSE